MIDLGKVRIPILEDEDGKPTWKICEDNGFLNGYRVIPMSGDETKDEWVFVIGGETNPYIRVGPAGASTHEEMIRICQAISVAYQMYVEQYPNGSN